MGFLGAVVGAVGGFIVGGPVGAVAGAAAGYGAEEALSSGGGKGPSVSYAKPADYSDAMVVASDNSKQTALAQIMSQQFTLRQAAMDQEMRRAANLELSLEKFDVKLQTGKLGFLQAMKAEENRHMEKIAAHAAQFNRMTASASDTSPDLPPPAES